MLRCDASAFDKSVTCTNAFLCKISAEKSLNLDFSHEYLIETLLYNNILVPSEEGKISFLLIAL